MTKWVEIVGKTPKKSAFKAGLVRSACLFLVTGGLMSSTAFAQSSPDASTTKPVNTDKPVSASPSLPSSIAANEALPHNLRPEELAAPLAQTLAPVKNKRKSNRNSWNTSTLTQTTGLSAASFFRSGQKTYDQIPVAQTSTEAELRAVDVLTAEDLLSGGDKSRRQSKTVQLGSEYADGVVDLGSSMRGALFNLPTNNNINGSVFKLDQAQRLCLGTVDECRANETRRIDIGYTKNIVQQNVIGLDLQLTPRAGLQFDEESKSALLGALVRIGDNLHEGSKRKSNAWYVFAGADAESVSYTPNSARRLTSGDFHLQNRVLDTQAGVGYRIGDTNLAFTYFNRQALSDNNDYNEDAAALSITWKR